LQTPKWRFKPPRVPLNGFVVEVVRFLSINDTYMIENFKTEFAERAASLSPDALGFLLDYGNLDKDFDGWDKFKLVPGSKEDQAVKRPKSPPGDPLMDGRLSQRNSFNTVWGQR
jgi:hypothetical protein